MGCPARELDDSGFIAIACDCAGFCILADTAGREPTEMLEVNDGV
jgi:hypothetical protein